MEKPLLALSFIVKNEGKYALGMIDSVSSIISYACVVDTGSTDESITLIHDFLLARNIGHEIITTEFKSFSDARNKSINIVPSYLDYILILDCDEEIPRDQHELLLGLMNNSINGYDGCYFPRVNLVDNSTPFLYPDLQLRLLKNKGFLYFGDVHEMPQGGEWLMPSSGQFAEFPHIYHYKYIRKTSYELNEREYQYQSIYRKHAVVRKKSILKVLESIADPFSKELIKNLQTEMQYSNCAHLYFKEVVEKDIKLIANIGCKEGLSTILLAEQLIMHGKDSTIIAIDTWLGSFYKLINEDTISCDDTNINAEDFYSQFLENIKNKNLTEWVLPLALDPHNASIFFKNRGIYFDLIHLDFSHDYNGVISDLNDWWPLLNSGGELIGANYHEDNITCPDIKRAYDDFFEEFESLEGKCRIKKM